MYASLTEGHRTERQEGTAAADLSDGRFYIWTAGYSPPLNPNFRRVLHAWFPVVLPIVRKVTRFAFPTGIVLSVPSKIGTVALRFRYGCAVGG